jgi:hypothetical protein
MGVLIPMRPLILHSSSTAQWHALLGEAQQQSAICLREELESYLVFLLIRFTEQPSLASSVLGLEFLQGYETIHNSAKQYQLKDVADKCLLYAGLFPGRAKKRRLTVSYFITLGRTAYFTLSNHQFPEEPLFNSLSQEFTNLMDVLQFMRGNLSAVDLLESLELWHETRSRAAWGRWCQAKSSLPLFSDQKNH